MKEKLIVFGLLFLFPLFLVIACSDDDDDDNNDTGPSVNLSTYIESTSLMESLQDLNDIADSNNGHRAAGSGGYNASVEYIKNALNSSSFTFKEQTFTIPYYEETETPVLEMVAPSSKSYEWYQDFVTLTYSGQGEVTADIAFLDPVIPAPDQEDTTDDGCDASDYDEVDLTGKIAVIQRGGCYLRTKAQRAENNGAVAVLIFNEGQPDRTDAFSATLTSNADVSIPVLGTSYYLGEELYNLKASGQNVTMHVKVSVFNGDIGTSNLIVETTGGYDDQVIMLGAHLDSVEAGPGINDNGSGSAAILAIAQAVLEANYVPTNKLRFAWWAAEEQGLLGSLYYLDDLFSNHPDDFNKIGMYLNFDMVGSPNYIRGVSDSDQSDINSGFGQTPAGSGDIEQVFLDYFSSQSLATIPVGLGGTDDLGFYYYGIPACGLFTGASGYKSANEASLFGGNAGEPYDPCYHTPCDTTSNINQDVMLQNTQAAAYLASYFSDMEGPLFGETKPQITKPELPKNDRNPWAHKDRYHRDRRFRAEK